MTIESRKDEHLTICATEPVDAGVVTTGFESYRFDHDALPEIDVEQIDTSITFLGKRLAAPLIIGAMTGGTERAGLVNRRLAQAAARVGVGLALGSMRVMLSNPETTPTFAVRDHDAPVPLFIGNIGAIQLVCGVTAGHLQQLIDATGVDAMNFHLNPLQEVIQPEGDTRWRGVRQAMAEVMPQLSVPSLIKEVGAGIGRRTAQKLEGLPIAAVDVAGVGGTSWSFIEGLRGDQAATDLGMLYRSWGVPTVQGLLATRATLPEMPLIASGGIRNGLEIAKALRLGATACAVARPLLVAALDSTEAVVRALQHLIRELKVAMFCTGSADLAQLRHARLFDLSPAIREVS